MKLISLLFLLVFCSSVFAQYSFPLNFKDALEKKTRTLMGKSGENYWQNRGLYNINVRLQPDLNKVSGDEMITYFNNSPDTLEQLVISVLSDGYRKDAQKDYNYNIEAFNDGVDISSTKINGVKIDDEKIKRHGTNRYIKLEKTLLPGESIKLEFEWSFVFPDIQIRCGNYADSTFFVAYFYPRVAVYDDIDGWDKHSYTMMTEFYSDFNDYNVNITVPKDFVVWATGELDNSFEVFAPKILRKFERAKSSKSIVNVITKNDYKRGKITRQEDLLIYNFKAENVPDFAFGTSDKFLWDAISVEVDEESGRNTLVSAAYRQDSKDYYNMAKHEAKVLRNYSSGLPGVPYPYPSMTIFNGNSGMEFPMMCNDASIDQWVHSAGLAYHESAHTYFPFYMGTNERKYAWMDEGWASFFPMFYIEDEDESHTFDYVASRADRYYDFAGSEHELPIMTITSDIRTRKPYRYTSYNKSFFAYYYLYKLLGEDLFKKSLKGYMKNWNGKHPVPYDFFNSFNAYSGKNLDWYWDNWFFGRNFADLSVELDGNHTIIINNLGGLFVPIKITIEYDNGEKKIIERECDIWKQKGNNGQIKFDITNPSAIKKVTLGDKHILDIDRSNNIIEN